MSPSDGLTILGFAITLGIAIVGWDRLRQANRTAKRALELAEAAEVRANRLERAQFERRDVRWKEGWRADSMTLVMRNVGLDTAHNVLLAVDPLDGAPGGRRQASLVQVDPTDAITIDLAPIASAALSPAARARTRAAGLANQSVAIRVHMTWESPSGAPEVKRWERVTLI